MKAATQRSTLQVWCSGRPGASSGRRTVLAARLALLVVGVLVLAGCQLNVTADVVVQPDGSGRVVVQADADAELVERVPTLADDLVLDDFVDAGWVVDGPTPRPDGGLSLTLSRDFEGDDEATSLLRSLGPPFNDLAIGRREDGDTATNTVRGNLGLPNGLASFADDDLVAAVGSVPFADQFERDGVDPATAIDARLVVTLPGALDDGTNAEEIDGGRLLWMVPTDGATLAAAAQTEQAASTGTAWARPVATLALVALVAWVVFMTVFIGYVAFARSRRARRYRQRSLP
jgi:hypothetical protein